MEHIVKVFGRQIKENVRNGVVVYTTEPKHIGTFLVQVQDEHSALVNVVKLCAYYYDIYRKNYKCRIYDLGFMDNLINKEGQDMRKIPSWLRYYFGEGYIADDVFSDFQSLTYKIV